jgi:phosphate transport system substrate-binding protein
MSIFKWLSQLTASALIFSLLLITFGCGGNQGTVNLQGVGATFPTPVYRKWVAEFGKLNPNIRIDYQSQGSGAGVAAAQNQTADFGASDAPMSDEDLKKAKGDIVHIPTILGAVVITYNLKGLSKPLQFSPKTINDIFLGKIKKWDDAKIKAENADTTLPSSDISVVFRSDGSGTTDVFTDFMSKASAEWKEKIGRGKNLKLPEGVGIGAKGNEGVTGQISNTENTIGYVEYIYAKQKNLPIALIKNTSGNFITPSLETIASAAADSLADTPADMRVSITNAKGENSYPISSYTYILIYKEQKDEAKGKALVDFLWWATHDGAKFAKELDYAPLPEPIVKKVEAKLNSITSGGKALRQG